MFLKSVVVVCSSNRKEDQDDNDVDEEIDKLTPSITTAPSIGSHSHSNSNDSSICTVDLKQNLIVVEDDVSDSNAKMIANQSETIQRSVRTLSNSLPHQFYHRVEDEQQSNANTTTTKTTTTSSSTNSSASGVVVGSLKDGEEIVSKNRKIENPIISSRFDLIDNASDVSMTGDTFKLIASDIVRLIPNMKVDGIKLCESSSPISSYEIEEATLRLFGQLFQNLGLIECCRADLFNSNTDQDELTVEIIKNDMISTMENVWKELEFKPHRLNTFKSILKILSCMQQESISKSVMDIKSKFKSEYGGKVRLFDGRMWVVELYFNNSSIEVVHYRTEKLCSSGSKIIGQEISSTSTPRALSGIEEVCKFVWSNTFTFQLVDDELELNSRSLIDFQSIETMNDNLEIVKSFLEEIGITHHEESSREECEKLLENHFHNFFKLNN